MTIISHDPRTGTANGVVQETSPRAVAQAVKVAVSAAPMLAEHRPSVRREWLGALADALVAHVDELVALGDRETALGGERLTSEVHRAAGQLRFYGDVAGEGSFLDATIDSRTDTTPALARVNRPIGPVAVFGASNFPLAFGVLGNDTGSALAAGCPVVAKAHPAHPLLSEALAARARKALRAAGAPEGTFQVLAGYDAGVQLVREEGIAAVAFTGSQAGGLALWREANAREVVIPVYAEMGTLNPVVVTAAATARMPEVAAGFVASFTMGSGQFCTKPGLLLAPAGSGAAAAVARALEASSAPGPMLTEEIARGVEAGLRELRDAEGVVVASVSGPAAGWSAPAVVLEAPAAELKPGSRLLEECFGPVALVVEYADRDELRGVVQRLQGALAASVMTGGADDPDTSALVALLAPRVGRVAVDDWPTGVAVLWAQQHGGPWPATSAPWSTSVGAGTLDRFVRPVAYQSVPDSSLPSALRAANPWGLPRRVDGAVILPKPRR